MRRRNFRNLITVCICAASALIALPRAAKTQASERSVTAMDARPGSLAASAAGIVVVAGWYSGGASSAAVVVSTSENGGQSFSQPIRAGSAVPGNRLLRPAIVVLPPGKGGGGHTIVAAWSRGREGVAVGRSRDLGRSFQVLVLTPPDLPGRAVLSSLALGNDGAVHALWTSGSNLLYARSDGFKMSAVRRIDTAVSPCAVSAVAVSPSNIVTAFWYRSFGPGDEEFAVARTSGTAGTFGRPLRASGERWGFKGCPGASPSLSVDAQGAVRFVFQAVIAGASPNTTTIFTDRVRPDGTPQPRAFVDTVGFTDARNPRLVPDQEGGLSLGWEGTRNGRRYVTLRHSPGAPGGRGGLDADWMRPGPPIVLDHSGHGTAPAVAPLAGGVVAAWLTGPSDGRILRTRRISVDELCGLPAAQTPGPGGPRKAP